MRWRITVEAEEGDYHRQDLWNHAKHSLLVTHISFCWLKAPHDADESAKACPAAAGAVCCKRAAAARHDPAFVQSWIGQLMQQAPDMLTQGFKVPSNRTTWMPCIDTDDNTGCCVDELVQHLGAKEGGVCPQPRELHQGPPHGAHHKDQRLAADGHLQDVVDRWRTKGVK